MAAWSERAHFPVYCREKSMISSLCNLCVLCVSVVYGLLNHRDAEDTEVAQRSRLDVHLSRGDFDNFGQDSLFEVPLL